MCVYPLQSLLASTEHLLRQVRFVGDLSASESTTSEPDCHNLTVFVTACLNIPFLAHVYYELPLPVSGPNTQLGIVGSKLV